MNIHITNSLPKPDPFSLLVLMVSTDQISLLAEQLQDYQEEIAIFLKDRGELGKKSLINVRGQVTVLLGLGEKPSLEQLRKTAHTAVKTANEYGFGKLVISGTNSDWEFDAYKALTESLILSNYQFLTYRSEAKPNRLSEVLIHSNHPKAGTALEQGKKIAQATCIARDLVNEPVITLTAEELSKRIEGYGKEHGFSVEVFHKAKIEALKMGGLLAVNAGSIDPPTFSILEYKPKDPHNRAPIILVGKGVVFDTGGLSLKPTANSMDFMKADMGGAAAVIGAFCAISSLELPYHVIGLIPATDNRPGVNAYVPGDVITMHSGKTVEVKNTDAEGRMILADALSYAKKYEPELVIELSTLTGASVVAVGSPGICMMSTASDTINSQIKAAGDLVYERLVELPLWEEYGDMLRSEIADLKNLGGKEGGAITAGKFLEAFTDYPFIHLDIAGPSFSFKTDSYRGSQGTGVGVRLLAEFIQKYTTN